MLASGMPPPTHLLFDFFGTLVSYSASRVDQGYRRSYEIFATEAGDVGYVEFLARLDGTFDELEQQAQTSLDEYSMDAVCRALFERVTARVPGERVISSFRDAYLGEWGRGVRYIAGVDALLAELARRFTLVLVTNTHHARLVHDHLRACGIAPYLSAVVTSVEHGKRKPSACIFEQALRQTGGTSSRSIHVGDSFSADYGGAKAAGLGGLLLDPDERHDIPARDRLRNIFDVRSRLG